MISNPKVTFNTIWIIFQVTLKYSFFFVSVVSNWDSQWTEVNLGKFLLLTIDTKIVIKFDLQDVINTTVWPIDEISSKWSPIFGNVLFFAQKVKFLTSESQSAAKLTDWQLDYNRNIYFFKLVKQNRYRHL